MPEGFAFTKDTAQRIVDATRYVEGQQASERGPSAKGPRPTYPSWSAYAIGTAMQRQSRSLRWSLLVMALFVLSWAQTAS